MLRVLLLLLMLAGCAQAAPPTVFSWSDAGIPGVTPMVWCDGDLPPDSAIDIAALASKPAGKRCIFLWHAQPQLLSWNNDPVRVVKEGLNERPYQDWLLEVLERIKAAGVVPDRIVVDYEGNLSYWVLPPTWYAPIWADPQAYAKLPAYVKAYPLNVYQGQPYVKEAAEAWDKYAQSIVNAALRRSITATVHHVFGPGVPVSNYGDSYSAFTTFEHYNHPVNVSGMGTDASPECYLSSIAQRYENRQRPASWNRFIDCNNYVRNQPVPCVPWVSIGGAEHAKTELLLKHMAENGIDTFLLFNPEMPQADKDFARVFARLAPRTVQQHLPEIRLDAAQVQTKGLKTKAWQ